MTITVLELTTTIETEAQAQSLARRLVEERLAACVQISGPIQSIYRWKAEICDSNEFRLTIKTSLELENDLVESLSALHPYETPEILIRSVCVTERYGRWLLEQVVSTEQ